MITIPSTIDRPTDPTHTLRCYGPPFFFTATPHDPRCHSTAASGSGSGEGGNAKAKPHCFFFFLARSRNWQCIVETVDDTNKSIAKNKLHTATSPRHWTMERMDNNNNNNNGQWTRLSSSYGPASQPAIPPNQRPSAAAAHTHQSSRRGGARVRGEMRRGWLSS